MNLKRGVSRKQSTPNFLKNEHFSPPHTFLKFFIKDFFSKYDQVRWRLQLRSHLPKKSLMENFNFSVVCQSYFSNCNQIISLLNETFLTTLTTFRCVCNCCCVGNCFENKWKKIWPIFILKFLEYGEGEGRVEDDHELYSSTEGVNFISIRDHCRRFSPS